MGKCEICGKSGIFLRTKTCVICGKEGCEKCMQYMLTLDCGYYNTDKKNVWTCTGECNSKFEKRLGEIVTPHIGTDANSINQNLWGWACLSIVQEKDQKLAEKYIKRRGPSRYIDRRTRYEYITPMSQDAEHKYKSTMQDRFYRQAYLVLARNLEVAGRPLEAAEIYDHYRMYDKARELREKEKQVIVKRTDVSVNLNALLKQVRDGGIVVVYRCPHCGGKLKIGKDASVESIKVCEHCGSEIEAMELADFLKTALS